MKKRLRTAALLVLLVFSACAAEEAGDISPEGEGRGAVSTGRRENEPQRKYGEERQAVSIGRRENEPQRKYGEEHQTVSIGRRENEPQRKYGEEHQTVSIGRRERELLRQYGEGRKQLESRRYSDAALAFTRALETAEALKNHHYIGLINRDLSIACSLSFHTGEALSCMRRAVRAFEADGDTARKNRAFLETGRLYYELGEYHTANRILKSSLIIAKAGGDRLFEAEALEACAALELARTDGKPELAVKMLKRAENASGRGLGVNAKGLMAYACALQADFKEAERWLAAAEKEAENAARSAAAGDSAKTEEAVRIAGSPVAGESKAAAADKSVEERESAAAERGNTAVRAAGILTDRQRLRFREYQVRSLSGDTGGALRALEAYTLALRRAEKEAIGQSVLASQREFFRQRAETEREKAGKLKLWLLAGLLLLNLIVILVYVVLRNRQAAIAAALAEEKAENERLMSLAEELRSKIRTADEGGGKRPRSGRQEMLERLCEQYYVYEGTDRLQPRILKEVREVIAGLRKDPKSIEVLLDEECGGVMSDFRREAAFLKEEEFRLFAFVAAGLSSTAISTLIERDKPVVYNRISRLKAKIASSGLPDKERYLAFFRK